MEQLEQSTSASLKNVPQAQLRMATLVKAENENLLLSKDINVGSAIMAQKKPAGLAGYPSGDVRTNVYEIGIAGKMPLYLYDIDIIGVRQTVNSPLTIEHNLSVGRASDHEVIFRRFYSFAVFKAFITANPEIFEENALYFDCAKTLYALYPFPIETGIYHDLTLNQVMQCVTPNDIPPPYTTFKIRIMVSDTPESRLTLGDLSFIAQAEDASKLDNRMNRFLDIATSQKFFYDIRAFIHYSASLYYILNPSAYGFVSEDCPHFGRNLSFLGIGARKSIRPIEPESDDPKAPSIGMILELKKSPFHVNMGVTVLHKFDTLMENQRGDIRVVEQQMKGIYVETSYSRRIFFIYGLHTEDATKTVFRNKDGGATITVQEYYRVKYALELSFPYKPLVIRKRSRDIYDFFPMELLLILDNQRVKGQQQDHLQIKDMIKKTAVSPAILVEHSERVRQSFALQQSQFLELIGVNVEDSPIHVQSRFIPPPDLIFGQNFVEKPSLPKCAWTGCRDYVANANITKWAAVAFSGIGRHVILYENWLRFVNQFRDSLIERGNDFPWPLEIRVVSLEYDSGTGSSVATLLQNHLEYGTEFLLLGHPDGADHIHAAMKYYEQRTEIVTQGVRLKTIMSMLNTNDKTDNRPLKPNTLANIIHKFNMKMGGINYIIGGDKEINELIYNNTLIVGFSTNHPSGGFLLDNAATAQGTQQATTGNANGASTSSNGVTSRTGGNQQTGTGITQTGLTETQTETTKTDTETTQSQTGTTQTEKGITQTQIGTTETQTGTTQAQAQPVSSESNIGIQKARHQCNLSPPSVIGFSANIGTNHPIEFIGDFIFQEARRTEKIELIAQAVKRCALQKFEKPPTKIRVVIFRNACGEGSFESILKHEVPLVRYELKQAGFKEVRITLIVVNKFQGVRLVPKDINPEAKSSDQNIKPGTVVDTRIVHPKWTEFFLNSHRAIQGTAKTPRYTVLLDDNDFTMDTLQKFTHHLCFCHQIVYSPTSLPTPVFVAEEYAKRGRNVYNFWMNHITFNHNRHHKITTVDKYEEMTQVLSYMHTKYLRGLRLNA